MEWIIQEACGVVAMSIRKIDRAALRAFVMKGVSVKDMAAHFLCTTETVHRTMRRDGFHDEWVQRRRNEHTCEHCEAPAADRFCSKECWGYAQRRVIEATQLAPYVEQGAPLIRMSAELKVNRKLLRAELLRLGLHKIWAQRRYKKCASQKAGVTSASTAFVAVSTPSARLGAQMVGGTSCGG
jgi:hypothetical protein